MKDIYALLMLAVFGLCYIGTATALASSATVEVYSLAKETIHARLVDMTSGSGSVDYAVLAYGTVKISLERHKDYALFFSTGCHEDKEGHLKDCVTGICPESGCNVTNPPEAATTIYYKSSGFNIVMDCGFNVRIRGDFQSSDPNCYAISCNIAIKKCPISTIVKELQSPVACKAGDGVPACQYDATAPSTYSPSAGTSCFDNAIMKFSHSTTEGMIGCIV